MLTIRRGLHRLMNVFAPRPLSDRQIAAFLRDLFEADLAHTHAEGLRFYVKERIVTIYGTLYRTQDRENVIRLTGHIPSLKAIVDRMVVVDDVHKEVLDARVVLLLNDTLAPTSLSPA